MKWFENLKIVSKIMVVGAVISGIMFSLIGLFYYGYDVESKNQSEVEDIYVPIKVGMVSIYANGLQTEQAIRNVFINPSDEKAKNNYKKAIEQFDIEFSKIEKLSEKTKFGREISDSKKSWTQTVELKNNILNLINEGKLDEAKELLVTKETASWRKFKDEIISISEKFNKELHNRDVRLQQIRKK